MNSLVEFNSDQANETLSRLFKPYTSHSQSTTTYINMARGRKILFSSPKITLGCEAFTLSSQKYTPSFTCLILETKAAGFPSTYWKGMLAYEKGTHMTFPRSTLKTCSKKATLVCPSVLDSLPSTLTHALPSATQSYTVLAPCLPVKGEEAFMFLP